MTDDQQTEPIATSDGVVLSKADVEKTAADLIGEGQPLPVGAHDPANQPAPEPPGLLHEVDDLDRVMAAEAHQSYLRSTEIPATSRRRPDVATLVDARLGRVDNVLTPRSVREALLVHIAGLAHKERQVLDEYARAVRMLQETRDEYLVLGERIESAAEALVALGLDREGDHEPIEPIAGPTISDDQIV